MNASFFILAAAISSVPIQIAAQSPVANGNAASKAASASKSARWTAPRLPDGHPDLGRYWSNHTSTPLQRPAGAKEFLTDAEIKEIEDRASRPPAPNPNNPFPALWRGDDRWLMASKRTSIITDPKDGRIPPLTAEGKRKYDALQEEHKRRYFNGPEDLTGLERCITWVTSGPPMLPTFYNNNYQILQTPSHVAIMTEMVHDVRIIPTDGRPHDNIRQWMGDSRGHWEGDTLVVETKNFNGKRGWLGGPQFNGDDLKRPDENMTVTERFTRTAPDLLLYQFTVNDPVIFSQPWSGEITMRPFDEPILEYACHEANQALTLILSGARADERAAAEAAKNGSK